MEENLIEQRRGPIGFLKTLVHRFFYGDTAMPSNSRHHDNPNFRDLGFDLHPGPLSDAYLDAQTLGKRLLVYIYCVDNPVSMKTDELLRNPTISEKIASDYIFYPTPVTSVDGYSLAVGSSFTEIPIFGVVNPTENTAHDWTAVSIVPGSSLTAERLMITLSSDRETATRPTQAEDTVVVEQNQDFHEAETEMEQREQTETTGAETQDLEKEEVEHLFAQLPEIEAGTENSCVVKFRFDNGTEQIKVFYKNASISSMFTFVRHFAFPRNFLLFAPGCPMLKLEDSEAPIESLRYGNNFVVVVLYED